MPDFRDYAVDVPSPGAVNGEATRVLGTFLRDIMKRNADAGQFPGVRAGRDRLQSPGRPVRGDRSGLGRRAPARGRSSGARRPGDGDPQRAHLPGLAGGLSADRPPRLLLVLRGVHPHHRFDVQPARQVAEDLPRGDPLAAADRLAQLPAHLPRLAPGSQWLQPPGSRLHRPCGEQEGGRDPGLSGARRQHAAVGRRPLPALARLRQRHRRRQAAAAAMARYGRRASSTARRGSASGSGPATIAAPSRTW